MNYFEVHVIITIILISITFLVGITTFLLVSNTKGQPQDSVNGFYSVSIKDVQLIKDMNEK
jgi:hypothetical protein